MGRVGPSLRSHGKKIVGGVTPVRSLTLAVLIFIADGEPQAHGLLGMTPGGLRPSGLETGRPEGVGATSP